MKKLTVVAVEVGAEPEVKVIEHTLEDMHKLVGGWIEVVRLHNGLVLVINEEGMIHNLPLNFITMVKEGAVLRPVHEILGNVFFVSEAGEEFASLDKLQVQLVKDMFKHTRKACIVR